MASGAAVDLLTLPERYELALKLGTEVGSISGKDPQYKIKLREAMDHLEAADAMVEQLKVFSENEHFTEHSTESLRYLLIPAHRADLQCKWYPDVDDPERDEKRIEVLEQCRCHYVEFLRGCLAIGLESDEKLKPHLAPPTRIEGRPDRDAKVAQMRAQMALDKKVKALEQQLADAKVSGAPLDEDLVREHMLTTIQTWVSKSIGQLSTLQSEGNMLRQMAAHRTSGPRGGPPTPSGPSGPRGQERPRGQPVEPPMVITKEMVAQMSATGGSMNRADFNLVTKGYGPIGAPTMSMDELAEIEMANMVRPNAPVVQELDEDANEVADAATYKARAQDVEWDDMRRGDGNKLGMG